MLIAPSPSPVPRAQEHPFLVEDSTTDVDMVGWVAQAVASRDARQRRQQEEQKQQQLQSESEQQ